MLVIDRVPKKELETRYGIKETALRDRLKSLNILPEYEGRKAYINGEDLKRLDKLAVHLEDGGLLEEYVNTEQTSNLSNPSKINYRQAKLAEILNQTGDPFIDLTILQKFADMGWLIDTARLAAVLNISNHSLIKKKEIAHCGFLIIKVDIQRGTAVWSIKKNTATSFAVKKIH